MKIHIHGSLTRSVCKNVNNKPQFFQEILENEVIAGDIPIDVLKLLIQLNISLLLPLLDTEIEAKIPTFGSILNELSKNFPDMIQKTALSALLAKLKEVDELPEVDGNNTVVNDFKQCIENLITKEGLIDFSAIDKDKQLTEFINIFKRFITLDKERFKVTSNVSFIEFNKAVKLFLNIEQYKDKEVGIIKNVFKYLIDLNAHPGFHICYSLTTTGMTLAYILAMKNIEIKTLKDGIYRRSHQQMDLVELAIHIICSKIQRWILDKKSMSFFRDLIDDDIEQRLFPTINVWKGITLKYKDQYKDPNKIPFSDSALSQTISYNLYNVLDGAYNNMRDSLGKKHVVVRKVGTNLSLTMTEVIAEQIIPFYFQYRSQGGFYNNHIHYNIMIARLILMIKAIISSLNIKITSNEDLFKQLFQYFNHIKFPDEKTYFQIYKNNDEIINYNKFLSGVLSLKQLALNVFPHILELVKKYSSPEEIRETFKDYIN